MFAKKKPLNPNTTDTLIGEGSSFEGKLKSEAGIRIEGAIIGDVECLGDVTVGEAGTVKSNIAARNVIIAGSVHGNVTAKGSLRIMATGKLFGNIVSRSFVIDEGGVFQGFSKRDGEEAAAVAAEAAEAAEQRQERTAAPDRERESGHEREWERERDKERERERAWELEREREREKERERDNNRPVATPFGG